MWSLILHPGQAYHVEITQPIQLTNVSFGDEVIGTERSVVKVRLGVDDDEAPEEDETRAADDSKSEIIIAALTPGQMEVATTSVLLSNEVDYVVFSVTGENSVHLVGHYTNLNCASAGLHGFLMASDSDDEDSDCEVNEGELSNELKELKMDREAHMPLAQYALEEEEFNAELAGYEYKDKTYTPGAPAFVDLPLNDDESDSDEFKFGGVQSDAAMSEDDEEEDSDSDDGESAGSEEDEDDVQREVEEVREELAALKAEKEVKRLARKNGPVAMEE